MLPDFHRHCYQHFKHSLEQLQNQLETPLDSVLTAMQSLEPDWQQIQQIFQEEILPLEETEHETLNYQLQAVKTEMNKQLRLLSVDLTFLKAARQPATREQRLTQLRDRLTLLLSYCDALLNPPQPNPESE